MMDGRVNSMKRKEAGHRYSMPQAKKISIA
jgi:hypothetical protein